MSKLRDFQQKTLSYLKKTNVEKEEFRFSSCKSKDNDALSDIYSYTKFDESEQLLNTRNTFLIDHNLLKPLKIKIKKITLFYLAIFMWIILMLSFDERWKYFTYGCLTMIVFFCLTVLWFYISSYRAIEYRNDLLQLYENELASIQTVTTCDNTRFVSANHKRQGWVYISEFYDQNNFKNSDMILAYAILYQNRLNLYCIDDKFILKPKQSLDVFTGLLKKMKSCKKIAIDINETKIELVPSDLTMGRIWNKKYPIKLSASDSFCIMDVDAPASTFVDFSNASSEPYVVPSYHRLTPIVLNNSIYIFGVSAREKERWYYKIRQNCSVFKDSISLNEFVKNSQRSCFNTYMNDIMKKGRWLEEKLSFSVKTKTSNSSETSYTNPLMASSMFSLNVIFCRLFWDMWREQAWNARIVARIQRTLDRIILPPFLKFLKADELKMGDTLPLIFSAETPTLDDDGGFWINCPIYYEGKFSITINTQIHSDLCATLDEKNKEDTLTNEDKLNAPEISPIVSVSEPNSRKGSLLKRRSSLDEQNPATENPPKNTSIDLGKAFDEPEIKIIDFPGEKRSKFKQNVFKLLNDSTQAIKSTKNNFSKAIYKYAANQIENSDLSLSVKLKHLKGTLTIYFPPPPTNRIWLGFRGMPVLDISTKSKIGNRKQMKVPIITQLIERKLKEEFKDVLVIPSMIDLYLPFLSSGLPNQI